MVSAACGVVLQQKRDQLRAGAAPALEHHAANPVRVQTAMCESVCQDETDELAKLVPPLFQVGGPYHTLGLSGFVKIQVLHVVNSYWLGRSCCRVRTCS